MPPRKPVRGADENAPTHIAPTTATAGPPAPVPGISRYRDATEIGRGGMGRVLRASDPTLGRTVALKTLLRQASARDRRKFVLEAQVTGQLEHPSIVPVHELGELDDGEPYFTMKLVRGVSLGAVLAGLAQGEARWAGYSRARLLQVFLRVCEAIAFAHDRGVIHRDLKPDNVMVGEFGEVLVMDWGLARVEGREDLGRDAVRIAPAEDAAAPLRTLDGTVMGTPAYMPPEQAEGEIDRIGPRSDVYSLGAILYEILTLEAPFRGRAVWDVLEAVIAGQLEPPSRRAPSRRVPRELDAVVMKAMASKPARRYASAAALAADVQAFLDGRILAAADYTPAQKLAKWVARNRAACLAAVLVVAAGAGVAAVQSTQHARETRARLDGSLQRARALRQSADLAAARCRELPAASLVRPNGELDEAATQAWFDARGAAVDACEHLALLDTPDAQPELRSAVDRPAVQALRLALCREAWTCAAAIGQHALARTWVGRVGPGLSAADRAAAYASIEAERQRRLDAQLEAARERLARTVEKSRQWWPDEWIRECIDAFLRDNSPDLVRLLARPEYLDGPNDTVRLMVVQTLGRLGDATTEVEDGPRIPELLARRLGALDYLEDEELIGALCEALKNLAPAIVSRGSSEVHALLAPRLAEEGPETAYARNVRSALGRLPIPEELSDEGARAPRSALEFHARAMLHEGRGERPAALADLGRALERDADCVPALIARGQLLQYERQMGPAIADFDRAVAASPGKADPLYRRAYCHREAGSLDLCLADVDAVLAIDPQHAPAYVQRGWVLHDRGQLQAAVEAFDRAVAIDPLHAEAFLQRGRVYSRGGHPQRAVQDFNVAIALAPRNSSYAYLYRALAYNALRDPARALGDLNRCIRLNGSHPSAFLQRGQIYDQLDRPQRALQDYEQALAIQSTMWAAAYLAGLNLARQGRTAEARARLEQALSAAPPAERPRVSAELERLR